MSLVIGINKPKQISKWCEYKDDDGNVLAEIKIRGIAYKPYQVAIERAQNQIASKGYDVEFVTPSDKLYHELILDAAACHLVEDWKGISVKSDDGETVDFPYSMENAKKLFNEGDIGIIIWNFVKQSAEKIQADTDAERNEIMGKLENSTSGSNTVIKPKKSQKSNPTSTNG